MDPDLGKIKTCQAPAKPTAALPKCKSDENLYKLAEGKPIFCSKPCESKGDCGGQATCVDALMVADDGSTLRRMNGGAMGDKVCSAP